MAGLKLSHIYKVYPNGAKAVSDFNIDIEDCEFIVFVGPSGCGKSTTLRMIAGLEEITAGDLYIGDILVNDVQPKDRDIAMVFQNYALYPHMTVYQNMAFALKNKHVERNEINKRVLEAARILDIEDYLKRKPIAMSGGQRQRVALGRAIVRQPKVFLLDEPLSNLDAKLRAQMRIEITKLHKKLKTTFIYVTHDQVEAMTMGTRIVVMKGGFVQQIDTPTNLYDHPINKFVASFIGTPQMNFFDVVLTRDHSKNIVEILFEDRQSLTLNDSYFTHADMKYFDGETHVTLGIRPDYLKIDKKGVEFTIVSIEALGNETLLYAILGKRNVEDVNSDTIGAARYIMRVNPSEYHEIGEIVHATLIGENIQLFANSAEDANNTTIMPYIPKQSRVSITFKGDKYFMFSKGYPRLGIWKDVPDGTYEAVVPHKAIVPGNQYELKVHEVMPVKDKFLITLYDDKNDNYLFSLTDRIHEVGTMMGFGFVYGDLILAEESNALPIKKNSSVIARFIRKKEKVEGSKKSIINWYLDVAGVQYLMEEKLIAKLASIEGRKLLSHKYGIKFDPIVIDRNALLPKDDEEKESDKSQLQEEDYAFAQASVEACLPVHNPEMLITGMKYEKLKDIDCGYHQFMKVLIDGDEDDIEITEQKPGADHVIHMGKEGLEIYSLDTEIRLA